MSIAAATTNAALQPAMEAARERRRRRAAVAERLHASAHVAACALDWDALDRAPSWLSLPDAALAAVQRRIGAVLCAPALRLWIERPRVAAAREALGGPFLRVLLAQPDLPALRSAPPPPIDEPAQIAALLQAAGAAVLLASLGPGALQRAATAALAPASSIDIAPALARELIARALVLSNEAAT